MEKVSSIKMANEIIHLSAFRSSIVVTVLSQGFLRMVRVTFFFSFTFGNFNYIISSFYCKAERVRREKKIRSSV